MIQFRLRTLFIITAVSAAIFWALFAPPQWLGLVRYVGSFMLEPLVYIQTIFSHVRKAEPDPQTRLHADAFHPSVKAWFFTMT